MSKHTPGPWDVVGDYEGFRCVGIGNPDLRIQHITFSENRLPNRDDARLIATAPDLLEQLRSARDLLQLLLDSRSATDRESIHIQVGAATKAIDRAEGRS